MTKKKDTLLKIIPKYTNFILDETKKIHLTKILNYCNKFEIEGISPTLNGYYILIKNKDTIHFGILTINYIIQYTYDNTFDCSCGTSLCEHIGFLILYFTGLSGLKCFLSLEYLDYQYESIFQQNIYLCFDLEE